MRGFFIDSSLTLRKYYLLEDLLTQIEISNVLGELVSDQNILNIDAPIQELDLSEHRNGIYFVTLSGINDQEVVRLIKQ